MIRKLYLYRCKDCDQYFTAEVIRHVMYMCPYCKENGVDLEEEYSRIVGNVELIRRLKI